MVSRDTRVHLTIVALAFAGFVTLELVAAELGVDVPELPLIVAFYGLVFGGAHLYLAVRGEGGLVPPDARWRYVTFLAALIGVGVAVALVGGQTVGSVQLRVVGWAVVGALVLAYLVVEAREGYRSSLET